MTIFECANCHYERSSEDDGRSFTQVDELDGTPVVAFEPTDLICSDCIPVVTQ